MFPSMLGLLLLMSASLPPQPKLVVPSFPSLTIKTHITSGDWASTDQTLYLQGARQRTDTSSTVGRPGETPVSTRSASIVQCDQRRQIILDLLHKTYDEAPIPDWNERAQKAQAMLQSEQQSLGGDVTVTVDSVDTGERRQFGSLTARHVKVSIRIDSGPGAHTQPGVEERDGWYVDLPDLSCRDSQPFTVSWLQLGGMGDSFHFRQLGRAPTGYPIEQTTQKMENGQTVTTKTALVRVCERPLGPSLFERPPDYQPALHSALGTDFSKPDNWSNRVEAYLNYLRWKTASFFR